MGNYGRIEYGVWTPHMNQLFAPEMRPQIRQVAVELFNQRKFREARSLVDLLLTFEDPPLSLAIMYAICLVETDEKDRAGRVLTEATRVYAELPVEQQTSVRPLLRAAQEWTPQESPRPSTRGLRCGSYLSAFQGDSRGAGDR